MFVPRGPRIALFGSVARKQPRFSYMITDHGPGPFQKENKRPRNLRSSLLNAAGMALIAVFTALWSLFLITVTIRLIKYLVGHP
jgi:hypothetical protein